MSEESKQTLVEVSSEGRPVYVDSAKYRILQKERNKRQQKTRRIGLWIRLLFSTIVLALGLLGTASLLFILLVVVREETVVLSELYDRAYLWLMVSIFVFSFIGWIGIRRTAKKISMVWASDVAWLNRLTVAAVLGACCVAFAVARFFLYLMMQSI